MINPIASAFLTASVQYSVSSNYNYNEKLPQAKADAVSDHQRRMHADVCRDDGTQASIECMKILSAPLTQPRKKTSWNFWWRSSPKA